MCHGTIARDVSVSLILRLTHSLVGGLNDSLILFHTSAHLKVVIGALCVL